MVISGASILLGAGQAGDRPRAARSTRRSSGCRTAALHETEADRIGVELAARAGYDPRAAITLWQKMAQASAAASGPEFLSHASVARRPASPTCEVYSARVMPLYEQARRR